MKQSCSTIWSMLELFKSRKDMSINKIPTMHTPLVSQLTRLVWPKFLILNTLRTNNLWFYVVPLQAPSCIVSGYSQFEGISTDAELALSRFTGVTGVTGSGERLAEKSVLSWRVEKITGTQIGDLGQSMRGGSEIELKDFVKERGQFCGSFVFQCWHLACLLCV